MNLMLGSQSFVTPEEEEEALILEYRRRLLIQQSLTEFARAAGYDPAPHHSLLIRDLEALASGEIETLIVEMPPGSAKSTYVNFLFPAWFLARFQDHNVLTASHSSELAERWGRKTRNLITEHSLALGVELDQGSQAAYRWGTKNGGEYYAVGVGVGIAGFRADLGIIDDPFGSREDAESKRIRDNRWAWYIDDFSARLKPGARRVIMHTRWHDDDLAGRVKRQLTDLDRHYIELKLPAQAETHDPLGREPGEFLWDDPDGYNYGAFLRARKQESDTRTWASLYQQNPVPDEGDYFKSEWLFPVHTLPARSEMRVYGASDYAVTSDGGDYTVHGVLGVDYEGQPWLLDMWRKQASSDVWVEAWCDLVKQWHPLEWAEEQGQIRSGVGPFLMREARARQAHVARSQFPTRGDKAVRAQSFRGLIATRGLRYLASAPWRADLETELLRFPAGVHDDIVDMLGLFGQLLETVNAPRRPKVEYKPQSGYRTIGSRASANSIKVI
jgi:predicted phage terminase large subunit-like protein